MAYPKKDRHFLWVSSKAHSCEGMGFFICEANAPSALIREANQQGVRSMDMQTVIIKNELNGNRVRSAWQRESIQSCGMNSLTLSILLGLDIEQHFFKKGKPIARWKHRATDLVKTVKTI